MPVLKRERSTVETSIPSVADSKVTLYASLLAGDVERILAGTAGEPTSKMLFPLTVLIKEWNLTDEAGVVLPVNEENLRLLTTDDVIALYGQVEDLKRFLPEPSQKGTTGST